MADTQLESNAAILQISSLTRRCERLLEQCLDIRLLMEREWAENKLADFRLWVSGMGATTTDTNKITLGARLSHKPALLNIFAGLLRMLLDFIEDCLTLSSTLHEEEVKLHLRWVARQRQHREQNRVQRGRPLGERRAQSRRTSRSISPWSDQYSLDSDSDSDGVDHSDNGRLAEAMGSLESILDQLNNLSLAVCRTGNQPRLKKADSHFHASEHAELESFLRSWVLAETSPSLINTLDDRDQLTPIQRRLINANLRRRNRFLYAQKQFKKLAEPPRVKSISTVNTKASLPTSEGVPHPPFRIVSTGLATTVAKKLQADISTATGLEAATEIFNNELPGQFSQISSTTARFRLPDPPENEKGVQFFQCPCCFQTLTRELLMGHQWRRHLAEDICPYTCIYDKCPRPEATFVTRQAWMDHMQGAEHLTDTCWTCLLCTDEAITVTYEYSSDLSDHIKQSHPGSIAIDQIPTVLKASVRMKPVPPLSCPLCRKMDEAGREMAYSTLEHIAEHIHGFALLSLPWEPGAPIVDSASMKEGLSESLHRKDEPSPDFMEEEYFAENRDIGSESGLVSTGTDRNLNPVDSTSLLGSTGVERYDGVTRYKRSRRVAHRGV